MGRYQGTLRYEQYGYTWPPRPENAIPTDMFDYYQREGWVGQIKKNGTCTLVFSDGNQTIYKTRHNDNHKMWKPQPEHYEFFKELSGGEWCVFEAELLHNKGNTVKNTLYIFDILVWKGEYLVGTTFAQRQELLQEIFAGKLQDTHDDHWVISEKFWLAKPVTSDFLKRWEALTHDEDEGIVLKNPTAKLKLCNKPSANSGWQVKCRRLHKNFGF